MSKAKKKPEAKQKGSGSGDAADVLAPRSEAYEKALEAYAGALELLRRGEYQASLESFRAVEEGNPNEPELAERARTYARICSRKLEQAPEAPATAEESYYLGVVKANNGDLDEALALINRSLEAEPESARYLYARASVHALKGQAETATADLRKAVAADPQLRFQASNDPDFERIRDEASFIDVIEPTPAGA